MKKNDLIIPKDFTNLSIPKGKKIYFLSDIHLGSPLLSHPHQRENCLVEWLNNIQDNCGALFLLGDIFDFWFEYKYVVPKGHIRFLAQLCKYTDSGIPVHFFTGNHDIWAFDYLEKECGFILHTSNQSFCIENKLFLIGHGDALNPKDKGYLFLYSIFHNHFLQNCFKWIHPDIGIWIANKWSTHSRLNNGKIEADTFRGEDKEEIIQYCRSVLKIHDFDFFIFGHRHLPIDFHLNEKSRYLNTGDWITYNSFVTFDGKDLCLCYYKK